MKNRLQIQYCDVDVDLMGNRTYTPKDISKYCNIPIISKFNLDNALDTSLIECDLLNIDMFEPFTKFISRVFEYEDLLVDGDTGLVIEPIYAESDGWALYEYTDNDTLLTTRYYVKNVMGNNWIFKYTKQDNGDGTYTYSQLEKQFTIYRVRDTPTTERNVCMSDRKKHTVNLIEPTKALERIDCDNLTTTYSMFVLNPQQTEASVANIVVESTGIGGIITGSVPSDLRFNGYLDSNRILTPYMVGNPIAIDAHPSIVYNFLGNFIDNDINTLNNNTINVYIITPDGSKVQVGNTISKTTDIDFSYVPNVSGVHRVIYEIKTSPYILTNRNITFEYFITVVAATEPIVNKPTIASVLDRLFRLTPLKRLNLEVPTYRTSSNIIEKLAQIEAPEFSFTEGHLLQNLTVIGNFINGIPRLIPNISTFTDDDGNFLLNDWQDWNTVTFDELSGDEVWDEAEPITESKQHSLEDYATNFVSYVKNAVQSNNKSYSSITDPFVGGFISPRTENADFLINSDNVVIKVSQPIYEIVDMWAIYDSNQKIRITDYVVEFAKYITLSAYQGDYNAQGGSKGNAIYYTKGDNIIRGLNFVTQDESLLEPFKNKYAIQNIFNIESSDLNNPTPLWNLKDLAFQVKYIPYRNFKARQYKSLIQKEIHSTLFFNQQENIIDMESFGESVRTTQMKTGNIVFTKNYYFSSIFDVPAIGMKIAENYYIYSIAFRITNFGYKTTISFCKNFNKQNEYIGIKSDIRQYEISENNAVERNADYNEFCIIDTELDAQEFIIETTENASDRVALIDYLQRIACAKVIPEIANKLKYIMGSSSASQGDLISYAYVRAMEGLSGELSESDKIFVLPATCFSFGNSIVMRFSTLDNYAAGTTVKNLNDARAIEDYVKYTDDLGRVDLMEIAFGKGIPDVGIPSSPTLEQIQEYSKKLYDFTDGVLDESTVLVDFRGQFGPTSNALNIDKDSREKISFTYQMHFVKRTDDIIIGKKMSEIFGLTGDTQSVVRICALKEMPGAFDIILNSNMFTEVDESSVGTIVYYDTGSFVDLKYIRIDPGNIQGNPNPDPSMIGWCILTDKNELVLAVKGFSNAYMQFRAKI